MIAHQSVQAVEPLAHVNGFDCYIDSGRRPEPEHLPRLGNTDQTRQIRFAELPVAFNPAAVSQHEGEPAASLRRRLQAHSHHPLPVVALLHVTLQ